MKYFFDRQSLYERIWTEPPTRVAAELKVSSAVFKLACECAAIPLPPTGYWSRLRSGKNPERIPLPSRPHGADCVVTLGESFSMSDTLMARPMPEPVFDETVEAMTARVAPVLAATTPVPARRNFSRIAMLPITLPVAGKKVARPQASPIELRRYQLIADLCSLLERAGSTVDACEDEKGSRFRVAIYATSVPIYFTGDGDQQTIWLGAEGDTRHYVDALACRIEDRLHDVAIALLETAEKRCRLVAQRAHQNELESRQRAEEYADAERQWRRERAEQRRHDRARERRDELLSQVTKWKHAENIRAFAADVLAGFPPDGIPPKLSGWARWALREANSIDPIPELRRNPPERRQTRNPL